MAYAASVFVDDLLQGLDDEPCIITYAYIASKETEADYSVSRILMGVSMSKCQWALVVCRTM